MKVIALINKQMSAAVPYLVAIILLVISGLVAASFSVPAVFANESASLGDSHIGSGEDLGLPTVAADNTALQNVLNTMFLIVGALATVFIVIGGARFIFSVGSPDQVKQAKNTIIYAVVGLVVAIFASVIVNFIISSTS